VDVDEALFLTAGDWTFSDARNLGIYRNTEVYGFVNRCASFDLCLPPIETIEFWKNLENRGRHTRGVNGAQQDAPQLLSVSVRGPRIVTNRDPQTATHIFSYRTINVRLVILCSIPDVEATLKL